MINEFIGSVLALVIIFGAWVFWMSEYQKYSKLKRPSILKELGFLVGGIIMPVVGFFIKGFFN